MAFQQAKVLSAEALKVNAASCNSLADADAVMMTHLQYEASVIMFQRIFKHRQSENPGKISNAAGIE